MALLSLPLKHGNGELIARSFKFEIIFSMFVRSAKNPEVKPFTNSPNSWDSRPPSTSTISSVSLKGEVSKLKDPPNVRDEYEKEK